MMIMTRSYRELENLKTFRERFEYLRLKGFVGESTFGFDRYLNQILYRSPEWKSLRDKIIIRDNGCDLGIPGYEIFDKIIIHHMNPLSISSIKNKDERIFDPDQLICVSHQTHNAIHYNNDSLLFDLEIQDREPGDTTLW